MFETHNDLDATVRRGVVEILNDRLADVIDLQLQSKQAHWNAKGPNFVGLHELFDRIADAARAYGDLIAERAAALGGIAEGTVQVVSRKSQLGEYPLNIADGAAHLEAMCGALATFGKSARRAIDDTMALNDADTADMLTEVSLGVDKWLWMVESLMQRDARGPQPPAEKSTARVAR